jgi:hypothetical protein
MGWIESLKNDWSTIVTATCLIVVAVIEAWQQSTSESHTLPRLDGAWHYAPLVLLIAAGISWLIGRRKAVTANPQSQQGVQPSSAIVPGIPTLSALLGQNSKIDFDPKDFLARAHYSPITAEVEKNIKIIAQQTYPNDKEAFYARFIGVGLIAYQHDISWFTIFGSQLNALAELNSRGLIPVTDLNKHYDKAVVHYPKTYANYSFDQWLNYMKTRTLIATFPSQMVDISFNGKDFLKYLAHVGRDVHSKAN